MNQLWGNMVKYDDEISKRALNPTSPQTTDLAHPIQENGSGPKKP